MQHFMRYIDQFFYGRPDYETIIKLRIQAWLSVTCHFHRNSIVMIASVHASM